MLARIKKAFTMIELVVVIVILAVLAAIAVPTFSGVITNSKLNSDKQEALAAVREAKALAAERGDTTLQAGDIVDTDKTTSGDQASAGAAPWTFEGTNENLFDIAADGSVTEQE